MAQRDDDTPAGAVDRRSFLKGAAAGAAGAATSIVASKVSAQQTAPARAGVARPTEADARADFAPPEPRAGAQFVRHPGSDYMVDVLKALDFDYVAVNPGSAFEGIHESLINHGGNRKPEILTVLHEEAGAAMVEYTILLGIITVAVIAAVITVGNWVGTQWTTLSTTLP